MSDLSLNLQAFQKTLVHSCSTLGNALGFEENDLIVTHCEVNQSQGVGALLQRLFPKPDHIFSLRSRNLYNGQQSFAINNACVSLNRLSIGEALIKLQAILQGRRPQRILSIPYFPEDFVITLALKRLYDCPLCLYVMDDQNIYVQNVTDDLVQDLVNSADICFGISPELCKAYQAKFKRPFYFFPPVVESHLIQTEPPSNLENRQFSAHGLLIGNIWSPLWLERLRYLCRTTPLTLDWYGNPNRDWLPFEENELAQDGIFFRGYVEEGELIQKLRQADFAVIPTGSAYDPQDRPELTYLSLPSRSCFIAATANLPLLALGESQSALAQFINRCDLGLVCGYDPGEVKSALFALEQTETQKRLRSNAFRLGKKLSADGLNEWMWESLELGKPADLRFEHFTSPQLQQEPPPPPPKEPEGIQGNFSVIITPNEVTQKHGTGALVRRVFPLDEGLISLRSDNHYGGEHQFGAHSFHLSQRGWPRQAVFANIVSLLSGATIEQLFCVPYYSEDLLTAIAIKEIFGAPLAAWIMDDQNVAVNAIPDPLMREFLSKCEIRFATHPELRDAYENKFGLKFWLLPAVAPQSLIASYKAIPAQENIRQKRGALLGSIWSQKWFESLCDSAEKAGVKLDWYGNFNYYWQTQTEAKLAEKGIYPQGVYPETELAELLKTYPFVVVPYGTLDERDDQPQLSQLSLPGRILFALAVSNTPVILLGSPKTGAANFIQRFGIGVVCDYAPDDFRRAVDYVLDRDNQGSLRDNALKVAEAFSDRGIEQWIWQSLAQGEPADDRFESIFPRSPIDLVHFIEPPVPEIIYKDYVPVYEVMRRLKVNQYQPDFVIDVGASHGIWSHTACQLFPEAQFILIDPLINRYEQSARNFYIRNIPNVKLLEIAVSNESGQLSFQVSPDLYGSSLLKPADFREYETVTVPVKTLDQVWSEERLQGRGVLKLDVQCAEHIVLEGAGELLNHIDLVAAELSFIRYDEQALVFLEMLNLLDRLGFRYYDETGGWRSPIDGTLLQKEVVFIRKDLLVPETSRPIAAKA
ncbi:MAG: FkbM family methyltransferase [Cyanobacteria bacterium RI_101]|nr:FkbM family methyltransferase [Cyanobacteria bacterium RI_101]